MEQNVMEFVLVVSGTVVIMLLESVALACLVFMGKDVIRLVNAIRLELNSAPTKMEDVFAKATGLVGVVRWNVLLDSSTIHASLNPLTTSVASAPMISTDVVWKLAATVQRVSIVALRTSILMLNLPLTLQKMRLYLIQRLL